jgi:hypothetical protein
MIAGTYGNDAALSLLLAQVKHVGQSAARLERAGTLQEFELEMQNGILAER